MALFRKTVTAAEVMPETAEGAAVAAGAGSISPLLGWNSFFTRDNAKQVPAFRRAVHIVADTLSTLQLSQLDPKNQPIIPVPFLRQPDPKRTTQALLADTYEDLALWGSAYWFNPNWQYADGWRFSGTSAPKHASIIRVAPEDVAIVSHEGYTIYVYDRHGVPHPVEVPLEAVIRFEVSGGGWLKDGARTLQTAQLLEDAVRIYAATPMPQTVVKNSGPRKTPDQVTELLTLLEQARKTRSTAYMGRDLDISSFGFDAQQIGLAEARGVAVLDIARLTGIPSRFLSQGIANSSHNYTNLSQERLDLHACLLPFAAAIEQRLSFDDVTGNGYTVKIDFQPFLRADPQGRADWYASLIASGVMTPEEARAFEQLKPTPSAPTAVDPTGGLEGPNRTGVTD